MPSFHSVHDLEFAVQDFWAHLPPINIRCLVNSVPDRVVACIAAGVDTLQTRWPQYPNGQGNGVVADGQEFKPSAAEDPSCKKADAR
ncbi:hypothetical protein TNCV_1665781 [Trichonephila clavipes]|nr:hypothetical protein TNCV_1665781 [Trichonephila clavipes]